MFASNLPEPVKVVGFAPLAERIIDELLASDPALASAASDHRYDDRLPDYSADAVAARAAMLRDASGALSGVDTDDLDQAERVDHEQLLSLVERALFALTETREYEWNPLAHAPGPLLHALVSRPFAPVEERLESLAGRLAAVPDALATARATLTGSPRIHVETAAGQFQGTASFVRAEVPALLAGAPGLASTVEPVAAAAAEALDEFANWLKAQATGPDEGRDPRLGRRLWEAKLWHTLDTELTAAEVLRLAWENLDRVSAEIREAAVALRGGRADDETVRLALNALADEHPDNTTIVGLAGLTMTETTDFVRDHALVSLVDDPCLVQEMPEFARGVAVAYCDAPGPLETADVPTFYCIAPTPADWSPERVESFYREYNNHMVRNLTVHEAMPGHFLQLAHSRRYVGTTRTRAIARSGPFIEGWAVYAEQVMAEHGFGGAEQRGTSGGADQRVGSGGADQRKDGDFRGAGGGDGRRGDVGSLAIRLQQLKMQLRMTINAILDQLVHCEGMTEGEAMALMTQRGFQEEGEAAGKWRRALLTSTQLSTYFVGYSEVAAIAAARPAGVSLLTWHDAMLSHGSPSPRHLRSLLAR
jgi:uncharacterized protein (DUF885 family)